MIDLYLWMKSCVWNFDEGMEEIWRALVALAREFLLVFGSGEAE